MSTETGGLPGFWHFLWLFWMQPITLHRLLRSLEIDPYKPGWKLLRRRSPRESWYLIRVASLLLIASGLSPAILGFLYAFGVPVNWAGAAFGVALGVAVGSFVGIALSSVLF